ncbi:vWA domain-containing protein [Microbacterium sp.]|uniref:vWA domain-containing protein n=1 Tax=Microbacterium sp. TaxID=51671 RepID=UPI003A922103
MDAETRADEDAAPITPTAALIGFTHALRTAGLASGPDRAQLFARATARLGAGSREHVYWAGRATLCAGPDDVVVYDKAFAHWFGALPVRPGTPRPAPKSVLQAGLEAAPGDGTDGDGRLVPVLASADEALGRRDIASLSDAERRRLAGLFAGLPVRLPRRRGMRRRRSHRGEIDPAATVRALLRHAGEPVRPSRRRRTARPRRIVLLIDVSGSMAPYADSLLRLAHRVMTAAPQTTEVFTMGTRLTRVTAALRARDADTALRLVGETVPDWSGGTRLGEQVRAFLDRWGQRGLARSAVVVVASDGWEVGDAALLGSQMARLHLLAHAVLWANPHRGKPGYAPVQAGMAASLPWLDGLVAGHSLAAFAELLEVIGRA